MRQPHSCTWVPPLFLSTGEDVIASYQFGKGISLQGKVDFVKVKVDIVKMKVNIVKVNVDIVN